MKLKNDRMNHSKKLIPRLWKFLIPFTIAMVFVSGCGNEKTELQIFSPDAYAFPMGNGWELNGSFRVKGIEAKETENRFQYSVKYSIIFTDEQNQKRLLVKDVLYDESFDEEQQDVGVDFQTELDSTFKEGKYKALIEIEDNLSRKHAQLKFEIELSAN